MRELGILSLSPRLNLSLSFFEFRLRLGLRLRLRKKEKWRREGPLHCFAMQEDS